MMPVNFSLRETGDVPFTVVHPTPAPPRRVLTMSQIAYAVDGINWLHKNRHLVGGLQWLDEPKIPRFFYGTLEQIGDWQQKLVAKFKADFGDSL